MPFVKALTFTVSGNAVTLTSLSGHSVNDVVSIAIEAKAGQTTPEITGGTHTPANLKDLGVITSTSQSSRIVLRVYTYKIDTTGPVSFTMNDTGSINAMSAVIHTGVEQPTAYLASTNGQDNVGSGVTIPGGTVAVGSTILGILGSGADTNTDIVDNVSNTFSGADLSGVTIRNGGNSNLNNGAGLYWVEGKADGTTVGPFSATANASDRWSAASIELIASGAGAGPQAISGVSNSDADVSWPGGVSSGTVTLDGQSHQDPDNSGLGVITADLVSIEGTHDADPDNAGAGSLSQGAAPSQDVDGNAHADPDSSELGQINPGSVALDGSHDADADTSHGGSLSEGAVPAQNVDGASHDDPDVTSSGAVAPGPATITGAHSIDADSNSAGSVELGTNPSQDIDGTGHSDIDAAGSGTIVPGSVDVDGSQHADLDVGHAGSVSQGSAPPQEIDGVAHADPDASAAGAVTQGSDGSNVSPIAVLKGRWRAPLLGGEWSRNSVDGQWTPIVTFEAGWQMPVFTGEWRDSA